MARIKLFFAVSTAMQIKALNNLYRKLFLLFGCDVLKGTPGLSAYFLDCFETLKSELHQVSDDLFARTESSCLPVSVIPAENMTLPYLGNESAFSLLFQSKQRRPQELSVYSTQSYWCYYKQLENEYKTY